MFLDTDLLTKYHHNILNEADNDENDSGDEPTEDDAEMSLSNETGIDNNDDNGGDDQSADDGSMDAGGGDTPADTGTDMGGDDSGSADTGVTVEESLKKQKLFEDYKTLLNVTESLLDSISFINYDGLTDSEKKIFNYIESKMKENHDKLVMIVTQRYRFIDYKELMKLYLYLKLSIKNFTEIIKNFISE